MKRVPAALATKLPTGRPIVRSGCHRRLSICPPLRAAASLERMVLRRMARAGLVPILIVMTGFVSACGGGRSPTTLRKETAAKTSATKTARFSVDATATANSRTISQGGQGVVDFGRHAVDVTFARPGQAGQAAQPAQPA